MLTRNWQDGINVVAGVWLMVSPWLLGFAAERAAFWGFVVLGLLIVGVALVAAGGKLIDSEALVALLGAATFVAPWVLGIELGAARWNGWIVGALVAVVALWALLDRSQAQRTRAPG